jgi:hypothetical protein
LPQYLLPVFLSFNAIRVAAALSAAASKRKLAGFPLQNE